MQIRAALLAAAVLGVVGIGFVFFPRQAELPPPQPPVISLEKMGHLVALKMNYADLIEFQQNRSVDIPWSEWEIRWGGSRVLLVARGDCSVSTDLRQAKYEVADVANRTLTVNLSLPRVLQARVNHASREQGGSYFYAITDRNIEPLIPGSENRKDAVNKALRIAQSKIETYCSQPDIIATAKVNSEEVLSAIFKATGWTPKFVWK